MSNNQDEIECAVYKSKKKDETYVFIPTSTPLSDLPDEASERREPTADQSRLRCRTGEWPTGLQYRRN